VTVVKHTRAGDAFQLRLENACVSDSAAVTRPRATSPEGFLGGVCLCFVAKSTRNRRLIRFESGNIEEHAKEETVNEKVTRHRIQTQFKEVPHLLLCLISYHQHAAAAASSPWLLYGFFRNIN